MWRIAFRSPLKLSAMLILVACAAYILSGAFLFKCGFETAVARGIGRLGADLMVAPQGVDIPLQKGLLGGAPASFALPPDMEKRIPSLVGIERVAPQYFLASAAASCCEAGNLLLVGFDPARDFTVFPWLKEISPRPLAENEILVGGGVMKAPGAKLRFYNHTFTVAARLEKTGMGYFDNAAFIPLAGVAQMERSARVTGGAPLYVPWGRPSILLVKLAPQISPADVGMRLEHQNPEVKSYPIPELFRQGRERMREMSRFLLPFSALVWVTTMAIGAAAQFIYWRERRSTLALLRIYGMARVSVFAMCGTETLFLTIAGLSVGGLGAYFTLKIFSGYFALVLGFPLLLNPAVVATSALPALLLLFVATTLVQTLTIMGLFLAKEPFELLRGEG